MRILLVEDDETIAEFIQRGLAESYHDVDVALDGAVGLRMARSGDYDLVILDIMLPEMSGWEVCEALRRRRDPVPILMLTARDAVDDRVKGLELGADDYLPKPFEFRELLARVGALHRRDKVHKARVIHIEDLVIDTGTRQVSRAGQTIVLTPREYTLLEALARAEGRVLSRELIQERVWQDDDSYSNTVDVDIGQLRKKIDAGHDVKLLRTAHRLGYMLRRPGSGDQE